MGKFSRTVRIVITLVLVLVLVFIAYTIFFGEIRATNRDISLQRDSISGASEQELKLNDLKTVVEATQGKRDALQNHIVTESNIVAFLEGIESLEEQTDATIEVRSIEKITDENSAFVEELALNIHAEGSWESVYHTFLLLEALPYKIRMTRLQFSKSPDEEMSGYEWQGDFRLFVTKAK